MATAGMHNLNDTPSRGPLTAADLQPWQRTGAGVDIDAIHYKRPYIAAGIDQQGRYPAEAAHASTDVGADDLACASGIVRAVAWSLAAYCVIVLAWLVLS